MRKLFLSVCFLALFLFSGVSFATTGFDVNGNPSGAVTDINVTNSSSIATSFFDGSTLTIPTLDKNLFAAGTGNGGASSIASTVVAVPVSNAFVRKVITSNGDAAFTAGTMANGKPGQYISVYVSGISPSGATTGGNYTITPTNSTGFTSVKLSAVNDVVTFLYVSDSVGWVLAGWDPGASNSITITLKP